MTSSVLTTDDAATELRVLSDAATPAVRVPEGFVEEVLRKSQRQRRLRRTAGGVGIAVGVLSSVASFQLGRSDYFTVTQPSGAMQPTVGISEGVVFNKTLNPQVGDVVLAHVSDGAASFDIISRVMAQQGDVIACPPRPDGTCTAIVVNGSPVTDPYLKQLTTKPFPDTVVPNDEVFLIGDNRDVANDSRALGPVPMEDINGVAVQLINNQGGAREVPAAPTHAQPDDSQNVDPADKVPPASVTDAS